MNDFPAFNARSVRFLLWISMASYCGTAMAAGFALNEMSAGAVGNAFAGNAAVAEDASTLFFNPAGLARLHGQQFTLSGSAIRPSIEFSNAGSRSPAGPPATGGDGGNAGGWSLVPAMYYAMDLTPSMRFGIGIQSPFGLKTEYEANWVGRYQALKSDLKTIDINPSLSYAINERLAVGAGLSAQYAKVELTRAIDFGTVCASRLGLATCGPIGFLPQARDGRVVLKGDDWAFGFNAGLMFMLDPATRFGLSYRSRVQQKIRGDARNDRPAGLPGVLGAAAAFTDAGASADLTLPESLNLSAYRNLDAKWSVMGDINWTGWSRFEELRVRFDNGAPDSVVREEWRNTVRVGAAVHYRHNDAWKFRSGVSYENSPVRDANRTPTVPDSRRIAFGVGAQLRQSDKSTWDFGYAHIFIRDASLNRAEPPLGGTLVGDYQSNVNILSVQYNHSF